MSDTSVNVLSKKIIFQTITDTKLPVNKNELVIDLKSFS